MWQNRFFACAVDERHLWRAFRYVERNPVRAGMVWRAEEFAWSSARAHVREEDVTGLLDPAWWHAQGPGGAAWAEELRREENAAEFQRIQDCTYAGRPFGVDDFVQAVGERHGSHWVRGHGPQSWHERAATG